MFYTLTQVSIVKCVNTFNGQDAYGDWVDYILVNKKNSVLSLLFDMLKHCWLTQVKDRLPECESWNFSPCLDKDWDFRRV